MTTRSSGRLPVAGSRGSTLLIAAIATRYRRRNSGRRRCPRAVRPLTGRAHQHQRRDGGDARIGEARQGGLGPAGGHLGVIVEQEEVRSRGMSGPKIDDGGEVELPLKRDDVGTRADQLVSCRGGRLFAGNHNDFVMSPGAERANAADAPGNHALSGARERRRNDDADPR